MNTDGKIGNEEKFYRRGNEENEEKAEEKFNHRWTRMDTDRGTHRKEFLQKGTKGTKAKKEDNHGWTRIKTDEENRRNC